MKEIFNCVKDAYGAIVRSDSIALRLSVEDYEAAAAQLEEGSAIVSIKNHILLSNTRELMLRRKDGKGIILTTPAAPIAPTGVKSHHSVPVTMTHEFQNEKDLENYIITHKKNTSLKFPLSNNSFLRYI